jgi:hypothetical protein
MTVDDDLRIINEYPQMIDKNEQDLDDTNEE